MGLARFVGLVHFAGRTLVVSLTYRSRSTHFLKKVLSPFEMTISYPFKRLTELPLLHDKAFTLYFRPPLHKTHDR